jgi:pimeloyl-ACP methyl ester carboxylesterase
VPFCVCSSEGLVTTVIEGKFPGGEPYLRVGAGRPLVYLSGFTTEHANPTGFGRWLTLRTVRPFVKAGFEVYFTGRAPHLQPTMTFADLAASLADGLGEHFNEPVDVFGHSTGGSLVLQIIADRPEVVRRAVVASAAYRLGPIAKQAQLELLRGLEKDGRIRAHHLAPGFTQNWVLRRLISMPMRLARVKVPNPADPIATLRAEDEFDVYERLPKIPTETLVICGARDYFWTPEMFAETAHRMPHGTLIMYPKRGHNIVTSKQFVADVVSFLGPTAIVNGPRRRI